MKRRGVFVALAASAVPLFACASILGIDDVSLRDAGSAADASSEIASETSTFSDSSNDSSSDAFEEPIEIDAGPCTVCANISETTECALACDLPAPSSLAVDDTSSYVYFTNAGLDPNGAGGSVWKVPLGGGATVLLEDAGIGRPNSIAYAPTRRVALYSEPGANAIRVSDGGASGASTWASVTSPSSITIAPGANGGVAFYKSVDTIETSSVDTPGVVTNYVGELVTNYDVNGAAGVVGWTTAGTPNDVYYGAISAGAATPLVGGQVSANHVAVNGASTQTYAWSATASSGGGIEIRWHGTGSNSSLLLWTGKSVGDMQFAADDTSLFFTDTVAGTLSLISNGNPANVIANAQDFPGQIVILPTWILWVNRGSTAKANGRVMRIGR